MRKYLLAAGVAAVFILPSAVLAQQSCEQQQGSRVAGTVVGGGLGALLGSAVAGQGDRTTGAVIGGIGGAVLGNQLSKPSADCSRAYGYYDNNGIWHASGVERSRAVGYYDRTGAWVQGAPNGYYDVQGNWTAAAAGTSNTGYYDRQQRWVPASASGYYRPDGSFNAGSASGFYTPDGRWVAGPATGRYDNDGRWMSGQANGRLNPNGQWVEDAQPGHYENGRWNRGAVTGYYDTNGRWIGTGPSAQARPAVYGSGDSWAGSPSDVRGRQAWLGQRIRRGMAQGELSRNSGERALAALQSVRREDRSLRDTRGQLDRREEALIQARLDTVSGNIRWNQDRRSDGQRGDYGRSRDGGGR